MSGIIGVREVRGSGVVNRNITPVISVSGSTGIVADGDIDHDSLSNFASNEHFTQANITATGTVTSGTWQGTPVADEYGGTGQSSYAQGDILYASASNVISKLAKGTDNYILAMNGNVPNWEAAASGGGGIENVEVWYLEADTAAGTASFTPVTGWSRADDAREGAHVADEGDGMTEASDGVWAFPQTGMWWIRLNAMMANDGGTYSTNVDAAIEIYYNNAVSGGFNVMNHKFIETGQDGDDWAQFSLFSETLVDVTTLDARFKVHKISSGTGWSMKGQAGTPRETTLSFMRVGAT
jgi:hypothetical protein